MKNPYFDLNVTTLKRVDVTAQECSQGGLSYCTLRQWIERTMQPNDTITAIRALCPDLETKEQNKDQIGHLKKRLGAVVLTALLSGGTGKDNIYERVPLIDIDIDAKDNPWITDWQAFKHRIFEKMNNGHNVLYVGLSASGKGLWLVIPLAYPDRYEEQEQAIRKDFASAYVVREFGHPIILDNKSKNIASKRYISYDAAPIINDEATPYKGIVEQPQRTYRTRSADGKRLDLEEWLKAHGVRYRLTKENEYGTQYAVDCPWAAQHSGGEGKKAHVLWQYADGGIQYHCFHNSCSCHKWKEYRTYIEKGIL